MGIFRKVLCALELDAETLPALGEPAEVVLRAAEREARLHGAELLVVHALPLDPGAPMTPDATEQTLVQRARLNRAITDGVGAVVEAATGRTADGVQVLIEDGPADRAIIDAADESGADLVVVGSTGARGLRRLFLGSVAAAVVKNGHTSVLVARQHAEHGLVMAALDFTAASEAALVLAAEEAQRRGARLCVVHSVELMGLEMAMSEPGMVAPAPVVMPPPDELKEGARKRLSEILSRLGVNGELEVTLGPAVEGIIRAASERDADLLVLGTSARTGIDRLLLGSVAASVVRDAPCPVLVARPTEGDEERTARRQPTTRDAAV
jgi:nucleotide-binding universal stress UspA family protein